MNLFFDPCSWPNCYCSSKNLDPKFIVLCSKGRACSLEIVERAESIQLIQGGDIRHILKTRFGITI